MPDPFSDMLQGVPTPGDMAPGPMQPPMGPPGGADLLPMLMERLQVAPPEVLAAVIQMLDQLEAGAGAGAPPLPGGPPIA